MSPEQSPAPPPIQPGQSPYDFLLNPASVPKSKLVSKVPLPRDPFLRRVVIVLGGGIGLIIVIALLAGVIFSGGSGSSLTTLAQEQNELIRIATAAANQATVQTTKNLAVNTQTILTTNQQQLLAYAKKHGQSIGTKQLGLTKSSATDTQLANALAASNYDTVFIQITQAQLTTYSKLLKQTFSSTSNATGKQLLRADYAAAGALTTQAGSAASALANQ